MEVSIFDSFRVRCKIIVGIDICQVAFDFLTSYGKPCRIKYMDFTDLEVLGATRDDAAGEAFDKAARVLGLPYPGGPRIDKLAEEGNPLAFTLPKPKTEGKYDTSFSGLKTAFLNTVHQMEQRGEKLPKADLAASFRHAVVSQLTEKSELLLRDLKPTLPGLKMAMAGGVSANRGLRASMKEMCDRLGVPLYMPRVDLCTDNGAMIGSAAYYRLKRGECADLTLNAAPALRLV